MMALTYAQFVVSHLGALASISKILLFVLVRTAGNTNRAQPSQMT